MTAPVSSPNRLVWTVFPRNREFPVLSSKAEVRFIDGRTPPVGAAFTANDLARIERTNEQLTFRYMGLVSDLSQAFIILIRFNAGNTPSPTSTPTGRAATATATPRAIVAGTLSAAATTTASVPRPTRTPVPSATPQALPGADNPACDFVSFYQSLAAFANVEDTSANRERLLRIAAAALQMESICNGLSFEGANSRVIGPFVLPAGYYRAIVTTSQYLIARLVVLNGECETSSFGSLFNLSAGEGTNGAEAVIISEGCRAVIEFSNTRAPWTFRIESIR
jgi:hypothetical protein